eukprot:scaffold4860_cov171-Amphora_coffeaeformis.AAC.11
MVAPYQALQVKCPENPCYNTHDGIFTPPTLLHDSKRRLGLEKFGCVWVDPFILGDLSQSNELRVVIKPNHPRQEQHLFDQSVSHANKKEEFSPLPATYFSYCSDIHVSNM